MTPATITIEREDGQDHLPQPPRGDLTVRRAVEFLHSCGAPEHYTVTMWDEDEADAYGIAEIIDQTDGRTWLCTDGAAPACGR